MMVIGSGENLWSQQKIVCAHQSNPNSQEETLDVPCPNHSPKQKVVRSCFMCLFKAQRRSCVEIDNTPNIMGLLVTSSSGEAAYLL